jgi:hypothetical protein
MTLRTGANLIVLTIFLTIGAVWASAQVGRPPSEIRLKPMDLVAPTVISGSDLGFRIESNRDDVPVGKLVVRINGRWLDAQVGTSGIVVATSQ